ncbi:MAG: hypothetical protein DMF84_17795 [Acidobacteria bacterium]|nr:MAG: hypothetical protein DMF84_17795 [Acidobacteriota bacterium]
MTRRRPGIGALMCAWTGAAAFLASLLVFLYLYGITYGRASDAGPAGRGVVIDILLFSLFALHHSLLARASLKRRVESVVPTSLERSTYTWTASALFVIVCVSWQPVDGLLYSLPGAWRAAGYAAQVAGLAMIVAGASAIDVLDLAGVRQVLDARSGKISAHMPLKTDGAYRSAQHDRHSRRLRHSQHAVSRGSSPVRGTIAGRRVRRVVPTLSARNAMENAAGNLVIA